MIFLVFKYIFPYPIMNINNMLYYGLYFFAFSTMNKFVFCNKDGNPTLTTLETSIGEVVSALTALQDELNANILDQSKIDAAGTVAQKAAENTLETAKQLKPITNYEELIKKIQNLLTKITDDVKKMERIQNYNRTKRTGIMTNLQTEVKEIEEMIKGQIKKEQNAQTTIENPEVNKTKEQNIQKTETLEGDKTSEQTDNKEKAKKNGFENSTSFLVLSQLILFTLYLFSDKE
ncbi:hypothetical protein SLOPH_2535 [Spraguea lophii 42_110]|uniref:Uncharacterized protein n=1 Tax=Spraguea lophii (strain 42_110) TaxID=1358809 RepID=S7W7U9_SPRLO|nr:hypothetical protein SLOPH_2535 [Spraguea lophii 42_110]